jgi:phosphoglycolate phosphatase
MDGAPIVVFDLDGTLADTAPDIMATLNVLLARDGHAPLPSTAARSLVGSGARALIERGYAASGVLLGSERVEALFEDFIAHYRAHIADETRLFPGAEAALERLADAGFRLAVCTNKPEDLSVLLLDRLKVADRFAAICGRETFPFFKPDPRALTMTIDRARGDRERAIMIGDSRTDIETAKAAGVPVVAVDFGYTETSVAAFGPDAVVSHFDELWDTVAALGALDRSTCT